MDMAISACLGGLTFSTMNGASLKKCVPTICGTIIGGIIAGTALSFIL